MATAFLLFTVPFAVAFAFGLQAMNVNGGHKRLACLTRFLIAASNRVLLKLMPGPTGNRELVAYLLGGPFGSVARMSAHPHLVRLLKRWSTWRMESDQSAKSDKSDKSPNGHHNTALTALRRARRSEIPR